MTSLAWWVPIGAAVTGGVLVMASNIGLELYKRRVQAKSLAFAIRGEMIAIIEIVRIRNYVSLLTHAIAQLSAGHSLNMSPLRIDREYFPVYTKNSSQIGLLPPDMAACIARAYTYANSFLEDATMQRQPILQPAMVPLVQETLDVLSQALREANDAVELIEKHYLKSKPQQPVED